jgi:hypothetical protein
MLLALVRVMMVSCEEAVRLLFRGVMLLVTPDEMTQMGKEKGGSLDTFVLMLLLSTHES